MSDMVTLPAPDIRPSPQAITKWEREYRAFLRLLPELLRTKRGQFVAIHDERMVDYGDDPIELIKRVHARYGYVPIHVDRVTEQPAEPVRIPHYREYRPGNSA